MRYEKIIYALHAGMSNNETVDNLTSYLSLLDQVRDGETIDFNGGDYTIYNNVTGVTAPADSIPDGDIAWLRNKSGVTFQNGRVYIPNTGVSPSKFNFPTTLTIDGCSNITLINMRLDSKGESFGNSDASVSLGFEDRRQYLAQNGGHALLIARSRNIYMYDSQFRRSGSVAPLYVTSSDDVHLWNCFSNARSLGYACYAFDSWCGGASVSGFPEHRGYMYNCSASREDATFGSKGCVATEDRDVTVNVTGGSFADAFANSSAHQIGYAFLANSSVLNVVGSYVYNCASIGHTDQSVAGVTELNVAGVRAEGLRTAVHIQANKSFGTSQATYVGCDMSFADTGSFWSEVELSQKNVVANLKVTSPLILSLIDCVVKNADALSSNQRSSYGGLNVRGGQYQLNKEMLNSQGWGGSLAGSGRGIVIDNTRIDVTSTTETGALITATNRDSQNVFTHQYFSVDNTDIYSNNLREVANVSTVGAASLSERKELKATLMGCYSRFFANENRNVNLELVSFDGVSGSNNALLTFKATEFILPTSGIMFLNDLLGMRLISINGSICLALQMAFPLSPARLRH